MHHKEFLDQVDDAKVVAAIAEAEKNNTGHIRVYVSHRKIKDPVAKARQRFRQLRMHKIPAGNAVMIYLAPHSHLFAIIGGEGIHEKHAGPLWGRVAAQLSADLKSGSITDALVRAIGSVGEMLNIHFPRRMQSTSGQDAQPLPPGFMHD